MTVAYEGPTCGAVYHAGGTVTRCISPLGHFGSHYAPDKSGPGWYEWYSDEDNNGLSGAEVRMILDRGRCHVCRHLKVLHRKYGCTVESCDC